MTAKLVRGTAPATPFRLGFARAGRAHAGTALSAYLAYPAPTEGWRPTRNIEIGDIRLCRNPATSGAETHEQSHTSSCPSEDAITTRGATYESHDRGAGARVDLAGGRLLLRSWPNHDPRRANRPAYSFRHVEGVQLSATPAASLVDGKS